MTMEASLVEKRKNTVGYANKVIRKKSCRRRKSNVPDVSATLQKLFLTCREVFKGPGTVPPPQDVQKLRFIIDNLKPEDVGLSHNLLFFKPVNVVKGTIPSITYTTIYNCENFSMCIFFLPPTAVIPLHNHPGMTVFSKLLLGSMHIKSYDWVDPVKSDDPMPSSGRRLAKLKADKVYTAPCDTSVLYPTSGGNIHAFTAITPCAVLDVLGPPYSNEDGRDCTYYKEFPYSIFSNGVAAEAKEDDKNFGWLEEIEIPKDLRMDGINYLGPQICETT